MLSEERRQKILELLQQNKRVIAKDLAALFQISIDSVRRDLTIMEEQGLLKKSYGGAILLPKVRTKPQPPAKRYGPPAPHQDAIAKAAASYIQENDTVFIGGAGIHYGMIKHLPTHFSFTVVTNSLATAEAIKGYDHIEAYLIGGKLRASSSNIIDPLAIDMLSRFTLDLAFITGGGVALNGVSTATPELAAFVRTLASVSRQKICLAPHEKVGVKMFATALPLDQLDMIITDEEASPAFIEDLEKHKVKTVIISTALEE